MRTLGRDRTRERDGVKPSVLIVGGPDVDKRIDLMKLLREDFHLAAAGSEPSLEAAFSQHGFRFFYFPLGRGTNPLKDLRSSLALHRIIKEQRPDIVHAFATKPTVWGRLVARFAEVPVVVGTVPGLGSLYLSDDLAPRSIRPIYEKLQRMACGVSDLTIFYNQQDVRYFVEAGMVRADRSIVIPGSGVRTDLFDPERVPSSDIARIRQHLAARADGILVTMIGRVIRTKGVMEFARAADLVTARFPNVTFLLVGPDDQDSLDRLTSAELSRLLRSVRLAGQRSDVQAILASSDIFVLPSYGEGIARVLLEAASMGLPLIAARTPGCEDVVQEGLNGMLVPPRDSEQLAEAIMRLVERADLRRQYGFASRCLARERFDLKLIAQQTAALYRELLLGSRHGTCGLLGARDVRRPTPPPRRLEIGEGYGDFFGG